MTLIKRTYKLPAETLAQFEQIIVPGKRSAMIDTLLREWLARQQRERLRQEIITGCREMAGEYLAIEQEFHSADEELERYFNFLSPDDIRIQGTRVGIETVLDDYLNGVSPEEIAARYRSLTLEQVYATITYYLRNKATVDAYLARWRAYCDSSWEAWQRNSAPFVQEMRGRLQRAREQVLAEKGPEYLAAYGHPMMLKNTQTTSCTCRCEGA